MTRRISFEIIADILEMCLKENVKTRIMYSTNLSYTVSNRYISQLISLRMLQRDELSRKYKTTLKGMKYLAGWTELNKLLKTEMGEDPVPDMRVCTIDQAQTLTLQQLSPHPP